VIRFLLDVNVLIALLDPAHVQHEVAHEWFGRKGRKRFATCPLTENGLLRIVGHAKYPNSPGSPSAVAQSLSAIKSLPGHSFWPDSVSVVDPAHFLVERLSSHTQVTDSYLLGLARVNGGKLATMDRRLVTDAVIDGAEHLEIF
jgi:uncharacterized protein